MLDRRRCIEIPNTRNKQEPEELEVNLEQGVDKQQNILQAMTKLVQPEDMDGVSLAHQREGGRKKKKKKKKKTPPKSCSD